MTRRRIAWILILIVDAAYIAWGAGVAIARAITAPVRRTARVVPAAT